MESLTDKFFNFLCVKVFDFIHVCIPYTCLLPMEFRRKMQIFLEGSYRWLLSALWMLGIKAESSGKTVGVLHLWTICPVPLKDILKTAGTNKWEYKGKNIASNTQE